MEFLTWPFVALIFAVFFSLAFWKPIARLIDRTVSVSKKGLQASAPKEQKVESPTSKVDEFLKVYDNQLITESERFIQTHLDSLHPKDSSEREKFLLRNFAALTIAWAFDKTYYLIYGSQIVALHYLNDHRNVPLTTKHISPFYEEGVRTFPYLYTSDSFEGWLGFLVTTNLVQKNGDDVGITIRGREFLKYLVDQGLPINKMG
jgi:hypothetical protein